MMFCFFISNPAMMKLSKLIMERIISELERIHKNVLDNWIGVHDRMEAITKMFGEGSPIVQFVVIHGIRDIEKTTLAKISS